MTDKNSKINKLLLIMGSVALIFVLAFLVWWNKEIVISGGSIEKESLRSLITGQECPEADKRPIAIMLASDPEARPLSGIGQADIVFEMPVAPDGITRFMAVFQCEKPGEVGSVRSARNDFISLATGLKTIYAHWGGEHGALEKLDSHIIDNVDALKYEGTTFYRKRGVHPPHNGFTDLDLISRTAEDLKYDLKNTFVGFPHQRDLPKKNLSNVADRISVDYLGPYLVNWIYDQNSNSYYRLRGGAPEIDKNTNEQVKSAVVVVMKTRSRFIRDQYISVDVEGESLAQVYQNGIVVNGHWKKDSAQLDSKLYFYDESGREIEFAPGKIWVEIVTD